MEASLANLKEGAVIEQFDQELMAVIENIADPNTDATEARKITLTVTLKPRKERDLCNITIACRTKLSGNANMESQLRIGFDRENGVIEAIEPVQRPLFGPKAELHELDQQQEQK